jgi:hypothetical protein
MYPEYQEVVKKAPKPAPLPPPQKGSTRVGGPNQPAQPNPAPPAQGRPAQGQQPQGQGR